MDIAGIFEWRVSLNPYQGGNDPIESAGLLEIEFNKDTKEWISKVVVLLSSSKAGTGSPFVAGIAFNGRLIMDDPSSLSVGDEMHLEYAVRIGRGQAQRGSSSSGKYKYPIIELDLDDHEILRSFVMKLSSGGTEGLINLKRLE